MLQQDITIINDVTLSVAFECGSDLSGVEFKITSTHGERNLPAECIEVYDDNDAWVPNKAATATTGKVRIFLPATRVGAFTHLKNKRYSITAKHLDGSVEIIANGVIKVSTPETAQPSQVLQFTFSGYEANFEQRLKVVAESVFKRLHKPTERKKGDYSTDSISAGNKTLTEELASIKKSAHLSIEKLSNDTANAIEVCSSKMTGEFDKVVKSVYSKKAIDRFVSDLNSKINAVANVTDGVISFEKGKSFFRLHTSGESVINNVSIEDSKIKCQSVSCDSILIKTKPATEVFANISGSKDKDFNANELSVNTLKVAGQAITSQEKRISELSRRLNELEKKANKDG